MRAIEIGTYGTRTGPEINTVLADNETVDLTLQQGSLCWLHRP